MVRSPIHAGARLAEQLTALAQSRDMPLATLKRYAVLVGRKLHVELVWRAMAGTRKFVKVFLGSPGDLADERRAAKVNVDDFNNELAETFGCQVELVGWEDTLPELGRSQEIINRDLDGCDLFVGMLWKRWGTRLAPVWHGPTWRSRRW